MISINWLKENLFSITPQNFDSITLELFRYQTKYSSIYGRYVEHLGISPDDITTIREIPFLPISFYKTHLIKTGTWTSDKTFLSSGTESIARSKNEVRELSFYLKVSKCLFVTKYGNLNHLRILAILPSYIENGDSSLICMVDHLISNGLHSSGYRSIDDERLKTELNQDIPTILIGVAYALLDLSEMIDSSQVSLGHSSHSLTIIETGGMKGRKREITKNELHASIAASFPNASVHTEYGMTELMSQAYGSKGVVRFPDWCKPMIREVNDPFNLHNKGTGGLNIIDLANMNTCAFIETMDSIRLGESGDFEVLGRIDNSDVRGCSLLFQG